MVSVEEGTAQTVQMLSQEEQASEQAKFEKILYSNLENILNVRPA